MTEDQPINLHALQRRLENIYDLNIPHNVDDFLIRDPKRAKYLHGTSSWRDTEELLLVEQEGDDLSISLYIDATVLHRLTKDNPTERLHAGNLSDFCIVLEGVSHFLYLVWNAGFDRPVSLLELELQAEVDKYVVSSFLFSQQTEGQVPSGLSSWLFSNPAYDIQLDPTSRKRYAHAHYYAERFCAQIEDHYLRRRRPGSLINDIRRFYRLTGCQKIDRIASLPSRRSPLTYRLNQMVFKPTSAI